jgi:putative tRNA adenosine deaminase-associated protein
MTTVTLRYRGPTACPLTGDNIRIRPVIVTALSPPAAPGCHDVPVAYFTAVLARAGSGWKARDVEIDETQTLDELADILRSVAIRDQPVLAIVEREDEWFSVIRVDGEDDPRVFVSDFHAVTHSRYSELLSSAADVDSDPAVDDGDQEQAEADGDVPAVRQGSTAVVAAWAGETDLLDDLGMNGRVLRRLVEDQGDDPGSVLVEVGDAVGFGEQLEALR